MGRGGGMGRGVSGRGWVGVGGLVEGVGMWVDRVVGM